MDEGENKETPLVLVEYIAVVITTNICQWPIQHSSQVQGVT